MLFEILNQEDFEKVEGILNQNSISYDKHESAYTAICVEEVRQIIDVINSNSVLDNDEGNYDILKSASESLFKSNEVQNAFQELAETAELVVRREYGIPTDEEMNKDRQEDLEEMSLGYGYRGGSINHEF